MQQPFIFLDQGDGWESLWNHLDDVTSLADFTIRWGIDQLGDQPDPSVMTITLRDRTGRLAGNVRKLAGARIIAQISRQPTYRDMEFLRKPYASVDAKMSEFHQLFKPTSPESATSTAITIFDGIFTSGGTIERVGDEWNLKLTASSRMVLWKRLQKQGPTSSAANLEGFHWVGTPSQRLGEITKRAADAGAPALDVSGFTLPGMVAPISTDDFPSILDLLHRLFATDEQMPMWNETPSGAASVIKGFPTARPVSVNMASDGSITVTDRGVDREALPASKVVIDDSKLTIPDPVTQIVVNTKRVKRDNDGKLSVDEAEIDFTSSALPQNLKAVQKSLTIDSDVVSVDESGGILAGRAWSPSDNERAVRSREIDQINGLIQPESLTFDSRWLDPAVFPELFISAPSGAQIILGGIFQNLATSENVPLAVGAFTTIGGTISFHWEGKTPVIEHQVTPVSLPRYPREAVFGELSNLSIAWADIADLPLTIFGIINQFTQGA